jgi:hypothetical protein
MGLPAGTLLFYCLLQYHVLYKVAQCVQLLISLKKNMHVEGNENKGLKFTGLLPHFTRLSDRYTVKVKGSKGHTIQPGGGAAFEKAAGQRPSSRNMIAHLISIKS